MKEKIKKIEAGIQEDLRILSDSIYDHPELGNQEYFAAKAHQDLLKKHGFQVEEKFLSLDTAFKASFSTGRPGPRLCYMAEYDALPGIGHGCGHNMLGAASTGGAIVLRYLMEEGLGGDLVLLGTPAEESDGGKVTMVEEGIFKDLDLAIMAHPDCHYRPSGNSLALKALAYEFFGKPAHAGASPHEGINALDALVLFYNGVSVLRQQILSTARIHGVIRDGGKAANVIPDYSRGDFYIRAQSKAYVQELEQKLENIAKGAALATGCSFNIFPYEFANDNMVTNETLNQVFAEGVGVFSEDPICPAKDAMGSMDCGNVSHEIPAIHGYFPIADHEIPGHTEAFRDATRTDYAYKHLDEIVCILAYTGWRVLEDPDLFKKIQEEYQENLEKGKIIPYKKED